MSTLPKEAGEGLDWLLNALNTEDIDIATDENLDHIEMNAYEWAGRKSSLQITRAHYNGIFQIVAHWKCLPTPCEM